MCFSRRVVRERGKIGEKDFSGVGESFVGEREREETGDRSIFQLRIPDLLGNFPSWSGNSLYGPGARGKLSAGSGRSARPCVSFPFFCSSRLEAHLNDSTVNKNEACQASLFF